MIVVLQYFAQCVLSVLAVLLVVVFSTPCEWIPVFEIVRKLTVRSVPARFGSNIGLVLARWELVCHDEQGDQAFRRESQALRIMWERRADVHIVQSVTRSPLFVSFSEALVGMSTIRSYGDSARFMRKIFHELDQNTLVLYLHWEMAQARC